MAAKKPPPSWIGNLEQTTEVDRSHFTELHRWAIPNTESSREDINRTNSIRQVERRAQDGVG